MLVSEIWPDELLDLTEAGLRDKIGKAAMAGALGASLLGGGIGLSKMISPNSPISYDAGTPKPTEPIDTEILPTSPPSPAASQRHTVSPGATPHNGFPERLHNQSTVSSVDRVRNFRETIQPMVQRINSSILADRSRIIAMRANHRLSPTDAAWLATVADSYDVPMNSQNGSIRPLPAVISDLLLRVNAIPLNLAMAQAALESGWGSSELTRQANNLFGQKATNRHQDMQRVRNTDNLDYRRYDTPEQSIRSYMHNLNTHYRYEEFRTARAQLGRQRGMTHDVMARELSKHLGAYSTNSRYMVDLNRIMNMFRRS